MVRKPNEKCCICSKPLYRRKFEIKKTKRFSCMKCKSKMYRQYQVYNQKGLEIGRGWNKGLSKKNGDILRYGKPRTNITKQNISKSLKGIQFSEEHKQAISKARIELFDRIGRIEKTERGWQFARWKKQIYKRDKYICKKCKSIDNLFAHHILSWKDYPDLRFKLSNGITLCGVCHKKLHKNKTRNNPL